MKHVKCDGCPCLNHANEFGDECNLNYATFYLGASTCSDECELEAVTYGEKFVFEPIERSLTMEVGNE